MHQTVANYLLISTAVADSVLLPCLFTELNVLCTNLKKKQQTDVEIVGEHPFQIKRGKTM